MQTVAALTIMGNDGFFLKAWLRHYGTQIGRGNCYLISAGAGQDLVDMAQGCSIIRLPEDAGERLAHKRGRVLANLVAAIGCYYRHVIVGEPDELVVADPAAGGSLREVLETMPGGQVLTPLGLELIHRTDCELSPITKAILGPRRHVRPAMQYCKPCIISTRTSLSRNGRFANHQQLNTPDMLYLLGLKYCDRAAAPEVPDAVFSAFSKLRMQPGFDMAPLRRQMHESWQKSAKSSYWQFEVPDMDRQYLLPERFSGMV